MWHRSGPGREAPADLLCATFSIVARCPRTGDLGVAVATAVPAVGALVPHVSLQGAIATQSFVNIALGVEGLRLLEIGLPIDVALPALLGQDEGREVRQVHGVDAGGRTYAHTGRECIPWSGHLVGAGHTVAGNMLAGEETIRAMQAAFGRTAGSDLELSERLLHALEAGQAAGGDKRGKQSAALLVASRAATFYHNLRVDDHPEPVSELRRLYEVARASFQARAATYERLKTPIRVKW